MERTSAGSVFSSGGVGSWGGLISLFDSAVDARDRDWDADVDERDRASSEAVVGREGGSEVTGWDEAASGRGGLSSAPLISCSFCSSVDSWCSAGRRGDAALDLSFLSMNGRRGVVGRVRTS